MNAEMLIESPIIAAAKDEQGLSECLKTECQVVFILFGNICNIAQLVKCVKDCGKIAIVHMDLIAGLSSKEVSVEFVKNTTLADGIITTKPMIIKRAKEVGLLTIQRFFIIDSMALESSKRQIDMYHPDCVEIMPGIMPKILKEIHNYVRVPVIAGGLLTDKKDVMNALSAGADAISTTNHDLWNM